MDIYKLKNFVLLGDFNVNYDNPSHPMFSNLCTISNLYCLNQVVSEPTHEHHDGSRSTIDLVFVSEPSLLNQCDTISPLSNSDHWGILMDLSKKPAKTVKTQGRQIWRYAYADWMKACELIDEFNWDSILSEDIELSWELWYHQFMSQSIPNTHLYEKKPCMAGQIYCENEEEKSSV